MDTPKNFEIMPYSGCGNIKFGMTRQEVEQSIGHIDRVVKTADGVTELYNFTLDLVAQVSTDDDHLIEIGFGRRAKNVTFGGIRFFEEPPREVLASLCLIDPTVVSGFGAIVFPALGLSFTGFQDEQDDAKAMTSFEKGQWDDLIPSMKPFST